jgi:signal transduction histidine kinase
MHAISDNPSGHRAVLGFGTKPAVRWPTRREVLLFGIFEAAFYFAYRYGMSFSETSASPFWFPDTVLLCALLLSPPGRWWLFILAPIPIRIFVAVPTDISPWFLLATYVIDSAKGLATATLLRRSLRNPVRLETVQDFVVYCLYAVLLIPALAAFAGAGVRYHLDHHYWLAWEQWFMGNALAQIVITPAVLYWVFGASRILRPPSWRRALEAVLLAVGLVGAGYLSLNSDSNRLGFLETRFYAPVPFLFWAALRFGFAGVSGAVVLLSFLAVQAALAGRGVFSGRSPADTAQALQHFLLLRAGPLYLVAVLIEQTKRAEAEAQEQRMELAHMARVSTMGQLATALAHELNQPLGAMLRNAEAAEMILHQTPPDLGEVRAILSDIRQDDQRASAVIDRMRSLLKRHNLEFEAVAVKELLDQVTLLVRAELAARRVTLQVLVPPGLPPVRGDRIHLQQVLINLLVNGADAMKDLPPEQRRLVVQVRLIDDNTVETAVIDNGPGLPPGKMTHLFQPFYTTKSEGMGMGLVISRTIVESHGGRIWAENNADEGATFRFTAKVAPKGDAS